MSSSWPRGLYPGQTASENGVGSGAGEVMMSDGRAQGLSSAGFPVGCATPGDLGQVIPFPAPATSNRACGSPAPGSPPPFTGGMRFLPPGLVGSGRDDDSRHADQAAPLRP